MRWPPPAGDIRLVVLISPESPVDRLLYVQLLSEACSPRSRDFALISHTPGLPTGKFSCFKISLIPPFLSSSPVIQTAEISLMARSPCESPCLYHLFSSGSLSVIALIHKVQPIDVGSAFLPSVPSFPSLLLFMIPWPCSLL